MVLVNILLQFKDDKYRVTPESLYFYPFKAPFETKWFYKKDGERRTNPNSKVLDNAISFFNTMDKGISDGLEKKQDDW